MILCASYTQEQVQEFSPKVGTFRFSRCLPSCDGRTSGYAPLGEELLLLLFYFLLKRHLAGQACIIITTIIAYFHKQNIISLIVFTEAHLVWILTDSAKKILNWVFFLKSQWYPFWVHMQVSILTECEVSHSKYHNFWTTAPISVKKIAKCSPGCRLQFALIFIIKLSKTRVYGHFSGAHLFKKIAIFESTMKRTSAVHTYLYIFLWRVQTVALDCVCRFKIYVPRLAEAWRHRDNPPCEL